MVNNQNKVQNQTTIYPFLVILICGLLSFWVINPKIAVLKDLNTKISAKEKDTSALNEKIQNLKSLQKQFKDSSQDVELFNLAITEDEQMPEIIEQITSMASKSGVIVKTIRPDTRQVSNETVVNLSIRGDYPNLTAFVSRLEKNLRLATIKSININSSVAQDKKSLDTTLALGFFTAEKSTVSANTSSSQEEGQ